MHFMISPEMQQRIHDEMNRIEGEHDVKILFACESGSRAWGFPSPDSDYDVRMVYVHKADWYLNLQDQRDVIEEPITDVLDISGWDANKTLRLLRKSNPNILEWVGSPIIYRELPGFQPVRELLGTSFNHRASILHYVNMTLNNKRQWLDRDEVKIKKYLYTIRPLLCAEWVMKHNCQPPMLYHELLSDLHPNSELETIVQALVAQKQNLNELDLVPRNPYLSEWIDESLSNIEATTLDKPDLPDWDAYNIAFRKMLP